ncbi:MAG TPA: helix-turn-helix domain-containing protein [Pyrinomonadaceae bacterium]|nr:helix-turn-helix domain-containing protein [Pyrinomonadaceae bacterium]
MENGSKIPTNTNFQALVRDEESPVQDVVQAVSACDAQQSEVDQPVMPNGDSANEEWVTLSVIEGRYVARVLEHTGGNKQAAARVLAVDRKTLDRMIKRHHIDFHLLKAHRLKVAGHG